MILSNDFINTEVNATGRKSLHSLEHGFLGSGMMCEVFQAVGKVCVSSECWNMGCHTGASSSVYVFRIEALMLSGPVDLRALRCQKTLAT